ncbi:MAG: hypothetical protein ACI3U1_03410, partial [Peptococcaceae bacterium]
MKKLMIFALSAIMVLSMTACDAPANNEEANEQSVSENVQIPSPFIDCDTLQDAASIAGFEVIVPASISGYNQDCIQAI